MPPSGLLRRFASWRPPPIIHTDSLYATEAISLDGDTISTRGEAISLDGKPISLDGDTISTRGEAISLDGDTISTRGEAISLDGKPISLDGDTISTRGEAISLDGKPISLDGDTISTRGEAISLDGKPISLDGDTISTRGEAISLDGELSGASAKRDSFAAMILRDPVHGLVAFESEEAAIVPRLLGSVEVQRLRRIRQLGLTSLAFPGAEHTRFAHAVGAAHVMQRFLARLRQIDGALPFWQRPTSERGRDAIAAALLHDLGHGPLSHLFEYAMPGGRRHERWTLEMILDPSTDVHRILSNEDRGLPARVADLVVGKGDLPYLGNAVSGVFDVDRCDYLLRDALSTGVGYGTFDLSWLLRSLRFEPTSEASPPGLAIDGLKGITAIESFLLARLFMFQQVYFHKSTRAAETMIGAILRRAVALIKDGVRLPTMIPALEASANGTNPSLEDYLALDDIVLLSAIRDWEDAACPVLSGLCKRLRARELWKTLELGGVESAAEPKHALATAQDIARSAGLDPEYFVCLDDASDVPFSDATAPNVVFPDGRSRPLSDVSFLLKNLKGQRLTRTRLVFAPELRDRIRGALAA